MKKYVLWRRVSTQQKGDSGLGLDAQQRDIDLYLNNYVHQPFEVIGTYTGIQSGRKTDIPELWEAIDLAEKKNGTFLCSKLDRLSSRVSFIATFMERRRLNFTVATMPYADKLQLHLYAALAEQEREFISMRTKHALAEAKKRGVKLGGNRDGLTARNESLRLAADNHALKVINTIAPMRDSGMSHQQIAGQLNRMGVRTAKKSNWHPTTVRNILQREMA
ncbi:recombinase family protein [Ovoidimarina sediminis]|uniref:recombinase family protein n=1 Tax=Ovoidimarina sediminis TaxID=3079856 RepID=UPI0029157122|nr:recombinase family protein [Rhodophyticola sp. MJ-SS7]MDU8945549.1 recombinase family protein [Rhodophyticola sp. MJ-SS7]